MKQENMDPNWIGEDDIYREHILDHYKHPRNFGRVEDCTVSQREINPVCGDNIEVFMKIANDNLVEVKFQGKGCAISMAAMSMLSDIIKGKTIEEVKKIGKEDVMKLLGINLGVVRMKCGLLGLRTMMKGLQQYQENQR